MRVLWVSHFVPYPPAGGVLQRGFGLISGLSQHLELHLLALNQPRLLGQTLPGHGDPLELARQQLSGYCKSIAFEPIPSENLPLGRQVFALAAAAIGRSFTEAWLWSPRLHGRLAELIRRLEPGVVHFDTISLAPYIDAVPRGIPVSLGHHNIESAMMRRRSRKAVSRLAAWYLRLESRRICRLERRATPRASMQVVCSERDGRLLRRLAGARRVVVAENGVGRAEYQPGRDAEDHRDGEARELAFVGRMSAYTNRDAAEWLVASIWPLIKQRVPGVRLHLVGSSPPASALALAATDPDVKVWGFVDSVTSIVRSGTVFICPVRDGGGTKLKILDAMNRGWPIVAHPLALEGLGLSAGEDALVARNAEEFADAAASLLLSPARGLAMAQRAFATVRARFAFDAISARLAAELKSLGRP